MIKFFKNIRNTHLNEGKTANPALPAGRYLKYAIGEIVLVVIGILIALQINNWNEDRKENALEIEILKEVKHNLTYDLQDAEYNLNAQRKKLTSQNIIINWLESDQVFHDSLSPHFSRIQYGTTFDSNESSYHTLEQLGMRIISNDSLRNQISKIYDYTYKIYNRYNSNYKEFVESMYPINAKYFNELDYTKNTMRPKNIQELKADNAYSYYLKTCRNGNEILIDRTIPRVIAEIKKTIAMIDKELETRN